MQAIPGALAQLLNVLAYLDCNIPCPIREENLLLLILVPLQLNFGNGRLEEFLLDQSVTARQMRTPPIAVCVAAAMAMFNFTQLTRLPRVYKTEPICWKRLRSWAKAVKKLYTKEELAAEHLDQMDNQAASFTIHPHSNHQAMVITIMYMLCIT